MREQKDRYELFLKVCETGSFSGITALWMPEAVHFIIETPGCDNDIQHLMLKCPVKPNISYSFRDDTLFFL